MKKNLFIILFSMMAMSGAYFLFSTSVEAGECARTGTKINIDRQSVAVNEYTVNGDEAGYGQTNCVEEPLYYKVSIYKVLFCTADPYVSNDNPDFTSCTGTIFETALTTGKEIIIQSGVPSDLIDNSIILPIGSYSYAAIIVDNHLGLKHTETFIDKDGTTSFDMIGATANGPVCWTREGKATAFSGPAAGNHTSGLHPSGLAFTVTSTSDRTKNTLDCGAALPNDWATVDKYYSYELIDSISDTCDEDSNCDSTFGAYIDYDTADDLGVGGLAASLLLKADGLTKATARANAVKIGYFISFTTPKRITEDTIGLQLNFTTSSSVSVDTGKDGTSDVQVYALKVGADPFGVRFRTKSRRRARGSIGDWR
jgi:hypothetical protein